MCGCSRDTVTSSPIWVLKGEGSVMTSWHHCCSTLHGLLVEARLSGLDEKVTRRVSRGAPCLSDFPLYLLRQTASNQLYPCVGRGQTYPPFPAFSCSSFTPGRALSLISREWRLGREPCLWGEELWLDARAFRANNMLTKSNPRVGYIHCKYSIE